MKKIIITGGLGFIGSNFINKLSKKYFIINIDNQSVGSSIKNIKRKNNYIFLKHSIANQKNMEKVIKKYNPDGIINFAANSHVDRSILNSRPFINSNIIGVHVILECLKKSKKKIKLLNVSTDEVFGSLNNKSKTKFTEESNYKPNSPYSASKAAGDHLCRSYFKTYKLKILNINCCNNFGPQQHKEKFIPTVILKAITQKKIPIYGNGKQIREWIYVDDCCAAIKKVYDRGKIGESYNIGSNQIIKNIDLAKKICKLLETKLNKPKNYYTKLIEFTNDRLGHDFKYHLDSSKIKKNLKWNSTSNFENALNKTIEWYLQNYQNLKK